MWKQTTGSLKFNGKVEEERKRERRGREGRMRLMTGRCGGYWNAAEMLMGSSAESLASLYKRT